MKSEFFSEIKPCVGVVCLELWHNVKLHYYVIQNVLLVNNILSVPNLPVLFLSTTQTLTAKDPLKG